MCSSSAMRKCAANVPLNPEKFMDRDKMKTDIPDKIELRGCSRRQGGKESENENRQVPESKRELRTPK